MWTLAGERRQVVFADGCDRDIFDDHHLVMRIARQRDDMSSLRPDPHPFRQLGIKISDTLRRPLAGRRGSGLRPCPQASVERPRRSFPYLRCCYRHKLSCRHCFDCRPTSSRAASTADLCTSANAVLELAAGLRTSSYSGITFNTFSPRRDTFTRTCPKLVSAMTISLSSTVLSTFCRRRPMAVVSRKINSSRPQLFLLRRARKERMRGDPFSSVSGVNQQSRTPASNNFSIVYARICGR